MVPINCEITVAIARPEIPNAGINPYPQIKSGFKNIFRKKLKIKTFL